MLSSVGLPEPDGPMMAMSSAASICQIDVTQGVHLLVAHLEYALNVG